MMMERITRGSTPEEAETVWIAELMEDTLDGLSL
jgi:hypothetical protein